MILLPARGLSDRITIVQITLDLMQEEIHQTQPACFQHQLAARIGAAAHALLHIAVELRAVLAEHPLRRTDQEAARAASWIVHCIIRRFMQIRLHHPANGTN